ncbi:hypothetical protein Nmel_016008 [Mimus melanotis]
MRKWPEIRIFIRPCRHLPVSSRYGKSPNALRKKKKNQTKEHQQKKVPNARGLICHRSWSGMGRSYDCSPAPHDSSPAIHLIKIIYWCDQTPTSHNIHTLVVGGCSPEIQIFLGRFGKDCFLMKKRKKIHPEKNKTKTNNEKETKRKKAQQNQTAVSEAANATE